MPRPRIGGLASASDRIGVGATRRRTSAVTRLLVDTTAWAFALTLATLVRYDLAVDDLNATGLATATAVAVALQFGLGWLTGLYALRYRIGSFDEVAALSGTVGGSTVALFFIDLVAGRDLVPLSATVAGGFIALVVMGAARYLWRRASERSSRPSSEARRLIVFGAGEGGLQVVSALLRRRDSPWLPVAFVDDSPHKSRLSMMGVKVLGTRHDLTEVAARTGADTLVIAVPSAPAELIRDLAGRAREAGLDVRVLPSVQELIEGSKSVDNIRRPTMADLLGRHEVRLDVESIAGYVTGRRVLVTGAGGSIGSELCRQLHRFGPASLAMLDRDESALHATQLSIEGRALLDAPELILADITDAAEVSAAFREHRPDVVFHAAALKHLTLLERHPAQAVRVNLWGTRNVLRAAAEHGVERVVNVSTDKAADPVSVLGSTKRLAERLTAWFDVDEKTRRLSVRFGNVLGSRGSVLTIFEAQLAAGGPLTVTHPDVTRFFMTVEEACQLTIQAAAIGGGGQVLVLDMGAPVRIDDVARQLADLTDPTVRIVYTGLRPGEKLHEHLLAEGEQDHRPKHPLISHVSVPPLDPTAIDTLPVDGSAAELREALAALVAAPAEGQQVR
jgi:FlaA1/EpsC-like NDP-sugar epimerase